MNRSIRPWERQNMRTTVPIGHAHIKQLGALVRVNLL
jgi:hypothetical protein